MIVVVVQHFVKPGMIEAAERRIDANGDRMAVMPGFLFRHAMISADDPCKLVTFTAWESGAHYEGWCERQRVDAASQPAASAEATPYVRVETEVFVVRRSHSGTMTLT